MSCCRLSRKEVDLGSVPSGVAGGQSMPENGGCTFLFENQLICDRQVSNLSQFNFSQVPLNIFVVLH